MGKQDQGSAAAEGTRRATGGAADRRPWGAVLGQAQARDSAASRAVGITAARASKKAGSVSGCGAGGPQSAARRMPGTKTIVGCRPRSASG